MSSLPGQDRDGGYGWISIALHWLTAVAIGALLFAGDSIGVVGADARNFHTTVGAIAWLFLAARIVWRLQQGHPPRAQGQGRLSFILGMAVHYVLLVAIAMMRCQPAGGMVGRRNACSASSSGPQRPLARSMLPRDGSLFRARCRWQLGGAACRGRAEAHVRRPGSRTLDRIMVPPVAATGPCRW